MTAFSYPDQFHINAALGWLMLDNIREAEREFRKVTKRYQTHPDYLEICCRLLIASREWQAGLRVSERQLQIAPERPHGWLNHAYCLHELKRTQEAFAILLPAVRRFPRHDLIPFNLACYCCHLEKFDEALHWVNETMDIIRAKESI